MELDTKQLKDQYWRLNNLYYGVDSGGHKFKFKMNAAQERLWEEAWYCNVVLKARQLGFSTFIDLILLDNAIWFPNQRCGIIAHTRDDAKVLFRDKIKFPFDNLPDQIKDQIYAPTNTTNELLFTNNSSIRVGTSMRSGTLTMLHISEYGKICSKFPDKAIEVRTGSLNTVHAGQAVFIESTAEGRVGHFYDMCTKARTNKEEGVPLTKMDYKFHFFPWYDEPTYLLPDNEAEWVKISDEDTKYFDALELEVGKKINHNQRAWYIKKRETQKGEMKREFPATPDEAFDASVEGAFFRNEMAKVRAQNRIRTVPYDEALPVYTYWDLGWDDFTSIIFIQKDGTYYRVIDYLEDKHLALPDYVRLLQKKKYLYGGHFLPHDGNVTDLQTGKRRSDYLRSMGLRPLNVVPKIRNEMEGIDATRMKLSKCYFDKDNCERLIQCLDHYHQTYDEERGVASLKPVHDWSSHGVKAFEQFALGYREPSMPRLEEKVRDVNSHLTWRTI